MGRGQGASTSFPLPPPAADISKWGHFSKSSWELVDSSKHRLSNSAQCSLNYCQEEPRALSEHPPLLNPSLALEPKASLP